MGHHRRRPRWTRLFALATAVGLAGALRPERAAGMTMLSVARGGELRSFDAADVLGAPRPAEPTGRGNETTTPRSLASSSSSPLSRAALVELVASLATDLDARFVHPSAVVDKALAGVSQRADRAEIEGLLAESAAYMASRHPDYSKLAGRIACAALRRRTHARDFSATTLALDDAHRTRWGSPLLDAGLVEALEKDAEFRQAVDAACAGPLGEAFEQGLDYFGVKTLERSYLLKEDEQRDREETDDEFDDDDLLVQERPAQLVMRVALGIHEGWKSRERLALALETFELMASRYLVHASPTLFHAGTASPNLASCFLLGTAADSIEGIYSCLAKCASISKAAGGIGLSVSDIRAAGSRIRGTGGASNGLVPMLRVFDATARYVDQGGGKRPGAFAAYVEPWHADILDVLDLKKNHGKEERRARDLFYALWIPDLFMRRVRDDADWSLCCPDECPGLTSAHGAAFDALYEQYEREGRAKRTVKARALWRAILDAQIETGTPYMLYKDACNAKSNHQHLGTIRCSNLCCEIVEYADSTEVAVCNLASVALPAFVVVANDDGTKKYFDFDKLRRVAGVAAANLDATIDAAAYPTDDAERSNTRHRPVGLGVQGLADAFAALDLPFDSPEARTLNRDIFETLYFAALEASCERARRDGPYASYEGSPASRGLLQPDLWGVDPVASRPADSAVAWDWDALREKIRAHGLRNSLLVAPMPTASTAQIVGVNECFEPYTSNLYARRVQAGEFVVANRHLVADLADRGLWTDEVRLELLRERGSVQASAIVPDDLKRKYKTAWELKQKTLVDLAADRGPFVDQSQSLNAFIERPDYKTLTAYHFYGWRRGLKTGMYYLRTKPAAAALQFTLAPETRKRQQQQQQQPHEASTLSEAAAAAASAVDDDHDGGAPVCIACSG